MKNLFKTLITVITVVCMLVTCTTAFAAIEENTVTTYNEVGSVNVKSTVTGLTDGVIVTYLAANDADADNTVDADEIKYINQATAASNQVEFSYSLAAAEGETWTADKAISDVQYGSDDDDTAAALADTTVEYEAIDFSVVGAQDGEKGATASEDFIGKNDEVEVTITPEDGYQVDSIVVDDGELVTGTYTVSVKYGAAVVANVSRIATTTVYLYTDAETTDGLTIYDQDDNPLSVVTGIGYYVGGPVKSASIVFDGCNIDGEHPDYTYAAADVDSSASAGYFAVQLASADADDLKPATKAIVVKSAEDGSSVTVESK